MADEAAYLLVRDLTKTFGRFAALRSLSIEVHRGEFVAVVGRNGAGKTTFLKIVSSIIRSYKGEVLLAGRNLKDAEDAVRRAIGFVSHESLLYKDLTVRDNLLFYARMYGLPDSQRRTDEALRRVGLEEKASVPVGALSRGMKQRLSLARAFLHGPELVLLDEPFTGLDERACDLFDSMLSGFKSRGGTAIMATHDIERGWKHADRLVVFEKGRIVHEATPKATSLDAFRSEYRRILGG